LRYVTIEKNRPGEYTFVMGATLSGRTATPGAQLLGAYLKVLRERRGEPLRTVAKGAGVSDAYLSQIETNKRESVPSIKVIRALAAYYGVELDTLLFVAGLRPEPKPTALSSASVGERQRLQVLLRHPAFSGVGLSEGELRWFSDDVLSAWMAFARALEEHIKKSGEGLDELEGTVVGRDAECISDEQEQSEVDNEDE